MTIKVLPEATRPRPDLFEEGLTILLIRDNWNDWYRFVTQFTVYVLDVDGTVHNLGSTKIGQFAMTGRSPDFIDEPAPFDALDERCFSLGQDTNYYDTLVRLTDERRAEILVGLRDMANDLDLFDRALSEEVTRESLLRSISEDTVRKRWSHIVRGDVQRTRFAFAFNLPAVGRRVGSSLTFHVEPESRPPTNVHVLIGRNGVGKTRALNRITRSLVLGEQEPSEGLVLSLEDDQELFVNLVSVSFSAFDSFSPLVETEDAEHIIKYIYVGLQREDPDDQDEPPPPKGPVDLRREFVEAARACLVGARRARWRKALETLESDPLFKAAGVTGLTTGEDEEFWADDAGDLFKSLSSGHKIVLLTVTRLVETVDERTLVLLDEPEAHLHPPLLSAFVRCLSDLLVSRNGVAIAATHSPVVLQEVPRSCVWILSRFGKFASATRPEVETFGENVGVLTREVFRLEVTQSGFHSLLKEAQRENGSYTSIVESFANQLGSEARSIALGLTMHDSEDE